MRKKTCCLLLMGVMICSLVCGCGNSADSAKSSSASSVSETSSAEDTSAVSNASSAENNSEVSAVSISENTSAVSESSSADRACPLEDGTYTVDVDTDSSMFHINEAMNGQGTLTVENGTMTVHIILASKKIVNLFAGSSEDAQKDGAELIWPVTDTVTYSDGTSEEVYGFDVPVPALDEEIPVAIIGTHDNWYDHTIILSNPQPAE